MTVETEVPMRTQAFVPSLVPERLGWAGEFLILGAGTALVAVLAQITIPLPWTPVPVTGQTFGVALMSLLWGRRAFAVMGMYLLLGAAGWPIFAAGKAGLMIGPTLGYLVGMMAASWFVGGLADRGWTRGWIRSWVAATMGSALIFLCGLTVLSFFVPSEALLAAGLWPFLPGDLLKNGTAAFLASRFKSDERKS